MAVTFTVAAAVRMTCGRSSTDAGWTAWAALESTEPDRSWQAWLTFAFFVGLAFLLSACVRGAGWSSPIAFRGSRPSS